MAARSSCACGSAIRPAERAIEPDEAHEHANYVQAGALIVLIGDEPPLEVHAGDSYVVPAGLGCTFEVLEPAILVEAISPSRPFELISGSFTYAPG